MAFLPMKTSCQLLLAAFAMLALGASNVVAFVPFPGSSGVVGRHVHVAPLFYHLDSFKGQEWRQRKPHGPEEKALLVERLLDAKFRSRKDFDEIGDELGLTNTYVAQLFLNQAQLKPDTAYPLKKAVPSIDDSDIIAMMHCPYRSFDDSIRDEPLVHRLLETVLHNGEGLKSIVNEKFGDGVVSPTNFYLTVRREEDSHGGDRVVITFNGEFLPFMEQTQAGANDFGDEDSDEDSDEDDDDWYNY